MKSKKISNDQEDRLAHCSISSVERDIHKKNRIFFSAEK